MDTANDQASAWDSILNRQQASFVEELIEFLRIPSVSAAEAHTADVLVAADWVAARMKRAGIENIEISPTGPHACVYGDWLHAEGAPTILIYGHFDVQPADPLELWTSPPFEPRILEGRLFARGAADMKANLLLPVIAAETMLESAGVLPINVKFLFEGQEEIGSRDLTQYVLARSEKLSCDLVVTPDGAQWSETQPAIWLGTKGLCSLEIDLETADMDLHSGLFGGAVPNANHALIQLLASLRNPDGTILVNGFYDDVIPLSQQERTSIAEVPFDPEAYRSSIGIDALAGEPGYSTFERAWARPTLEVNGMGGGYQGDGVKTVIPAKARAKITCRLVKNQEPQVVLDRLEEHLHRFRPEGARLKLTRGVGEARAYRMPADHIGVQAVASALEETYGARPFFVAVGGTLPIMDMFVQELNAYSVVVGFAQDDERMHSPNEFLRLSDFARGQGFYCRLFNRFGALQPGTMKVS